MSRHLALAVLFVTGCQPSITKPSRDAGPGLRDQGPTDGGMGTYVGTVDPVPVLGAEQNLLAIDGWRELKRDPSYLRDGGQQYLYFAGSPGPPNATEQWTLGRVTAPEGKDLSTVPPQQVLRAQPGAWDQGDLTAPTVLIGASVPGKRWALWYAASGQTGRPDYATQIGLATSDDGVSWQRGAQPVIPMPAQGPGSSGVTDPFVLPLSGTTLWMYYAGVNCGAAGCRHQILRAISADGVTWKENQVVLSGRDNVAEEAGGVAGPSVVFQGGVFYLAYTAVRDQPQPDKQGLRRAIYTGTIALSQSQDGVSFTPASGTTPIVGHRGFYAAGSFSPSLYADGANLQLLFAGAVGGDSPLYSIGKASLGLQ